MRVERIGDATLYLGDCLEILPTVGIVDAVVADPPYNFSTSSAGDKVSYWADLMNSALWFSTVLRACIDRFPAQGGTIWQFLNWRTLPTIQKASYDAGVKIESLLVWDKEWIGPGGPAGLRPSYELVALMMVGGTRLSNRGLPDIWRCQWTAVKPNGHPAEKPVALVERIIKETPGTSVLDPFMGSGTAGIACAHLGRRFVGIETEPRWFDLACRRIELEHKQGNLTFVDAGD